MRIIAQLKLSKWANWLVSLSHYPPIEVLAWGWWIVVIAANIFHIVEALHTPFAEEASEELIELLKSVASGHGETLRLGDIVHAVGALAIACLHAYMKNMRKQPWKLFFALVGIGKFVEWIV